MRLLFFDMEFADGRVPGSIYSIGYLVTDEHFRVLIPPTDVLIHPDSTWNDYVVAKILAYPKAEVEAAPKFPAHYKKLKKLFAKADLAVGFAVGNDVRALRKDCERYELAPLSFRTLDMEKLCKLQDEHKDAHGLGGYVRAWCGEDPKNQHRSDGDALATMMLLRAICEQKHVTPSMILEAFPDSCGVSMQKEKKKTTKPKRSFFRRRRPRKKKTEGKDAQPSPKS